MGVWGLLILGCRLRVEMVGGGQGFMSLGCGAGHVGFALMSFASGSSFSSPFLGERSQ